MLPAALLLVYLHMSSYHSQQVSSCLVSSSASPAGAERAPEEGSRRLEVTAAQASPDKARSSWITAISHAAPAHTAAPCWGQLHAHPTKVLIKAPLSFVFHIPECSHASLLCKITLTASTKALAFGRIRVCCLSNIWGFSKQLMIAESQCSCNMAYPH